HVGRSLVADALKNRIGDDTLFEHGGIGQGAKRIQAGHDARRMIVKRAERKTLPVAANEEFAIAADHDEDAASARAAVRLEHKIGAAVEEAGQVAQGGMGRDQSEELRRGNAKLLAEPMHLAL